MRGLSLLAAAFAGAALAQAPAPQPTKAPTPPPCPATAGLEIGMPRAAAFDMMRRKSPELKTTNAISIHHAPAGRPYQVDVTFGSEAADAKVVKLHYLFEPAGVFDAMRDRWGEPADRPGPGSWLWRIDRCGVMVLYHAKEDEHHQVVGEELTVEPLPTKK